MTVIMVRDDCLLSNVSTDLEGVLLKFFNDMMVHVNSCPVLMLDDIDGIATISESSPMGVRPSAISLLCMIADKAMSSWRCGEGCGFILSSSSTDMSGKKFAR